ncbi:hypothetical protein J6590_053789 [Homalodisca vitripennis]|nr:hypothetical protein J6590_053789 [Homalodisca vitripennis]
MSRVSHLIRSPPQEDLSGMGKPHCHVMARAPGWGEGIPSNPFPTSRRPVGHGKAPLPRDGKGTGVGGGSSGCKCACESSHGSPDREVISRFPTRIVMFAFPRTAYSDVRVSPDRVVMFASSAVGHVLVRLAAARPPELRVRAHPSCERVTVRIHDTANSDEHTPYINNTN